MSETKLEQLKSQVSADEAAKLNSTSTELIREIKNTPFHMINSEKGFFIAMRKHKISPYFQTEDEALMYTGYAQYDIIVKMICAILSDIETHKQEINNP